MRAIIVAALLVSAALPAFAVDQTESKPAGTAKGAAVGALAGHEVGSGHAVAGAAAGAAIGHQRAAKADQKEK